MPKVCKEITETYVTISRPVVLDVIRQLSIQLDLDKFLEVELAGDNIAPLIKGSAISEVNNKYQSSFGNNEKVKINFKERPRENSWSRITDYSQYQKPYFCDPALKVALYPVYDERVVEVGFTFQFANRKDAQRTLDRIRVRVSQLKKNFTHSSTYHFPVPDEILATLFAIYSNREATYGYGETLAEWVDKCASTRMFKATNLAGKGTVIAFEETQVGIIGGMDTELVPGREKNDSNLKYYFTGTYTFNYNSPISVILEYPMFVHNAPLPKPYRGIRGDQIHHEVDVEHITKVEGLMIALNNSHEPKIIKTPVNIPSYDEWNVYELGLSADESRLINVAISLPAEDSDYPRDVLDLKTLSPALSDEALEYIKNNAGEVTQRGKTPLLIELYEWEHPLIHEAYYITEDLIVRSTNRLDPRKNYHVAITVVTDMRNLSKQAQESVKNDPAMADQLIQFTKPGLTIPTLVPGVIGPIEWEAAIEEPPKNDPNNSQFWLVQNTILTTNKKELDNGSL